MDKLLKSPFDVSSSFDYDASFIDYKTNKIKKFNSNYHHDLNNFKESVDKVFSCIQKNQKINILLFGYIQSGKTDFLIYLIMKLFTVNKSNIIFSINQSNKDLLEQTKKRTMEIYKEKIYGNENLIDSKQEILEKLKNGENVLIFLLKNHIHLDNANKLIDWLNQNEINYNPLIIDDEGDAASFDNIKKEEETKIFSGITKLKENLNSIYVSITATPFAHFMVDSQSKIKPDYGFILFPSSGYIGLDYFIECYQSGQNNLFIEIDPIDKEDIGELIINNDFKKAIKFYITQCFWWTYVEKNEFKPRMLVNIHKQKPYHEEISESIDNILKKIKNSFIKNPNMFHDCFKELKIDLKFYDLFISKFDEIINDFEPYILNGDISDSEKVNLDSHVDDKYRIIIGHTKLDRGLTIINLINTFISSRSARHANADSILQQARFLGYRDKYKKMIRVFATKHLLQDYVNINENINYFKDIMLSKPFSEISNYCPIKNENNLFPTRSTIANMEYNDGNELIELINNKFYDDEHNNLDWYNEKFYKKTNSLKSNSKDSENNKIVMFANFSDFCKAYEVKQTKKEIINFLLNLCSEETNNADKNIITNLVNAQNNLQIVVRILGDESRKRIISASYTNKTMGKGDYAKNEKEFLFKANTLSIDIIPITAYDGNGLERVVYRTRIFVPFEMQSNLKGFHS